MRCLIRAMIALTLFAAIPAPAAHAQRGAAVSVALTEADRADLRRLEAYVQSLDGVVAEFQQINDEGGTAAGTLLMQRPGKLRFSYAPPAQQFVVSDGTTITYVDPIARETTSGPLSATPLAVLVAPVVKFSGDVTVVGFERAANVIRVTLRKTAEPDQGSLTLTFMDRPLALAHWTVIDAQKKATRVAISDVRLGQKIDPASFVFENPRQRTNN
jgi:outer membrane lipoprotein-sorting protein